MLEKMNEFFERRLNAYDEHMMTEIEGATEFYPFTASLLPKDDKCHILDLGCGTGLELEEYFSLCYTYRLFGFVSRGRSVVSSRTVSY